MTDEMNDSLSNKPLEELARELARLRGQKAFLAEGVKDVNKEIEDVKKLMLPMMDDIHFTRFHIEDLGTFAKKETIVGQMNNWDEFWAFVQETGSDHLLEKRIKSTAYRELLDQGVDVPGVVSFTKVDIGLTKR